jgi:uncharacterized protein (DUF1697 family)
MTAYAALVRGINVGGKKVVMAELRELVSSLGHEEVSTYVQSGNVVFRTAGRDARKLAAGIERAIAQRLGLDVTVLVRSATELRSVVKGNPFLAGGADPAGLHVTFLGAAPDASAVAQIDPATFAPDEFAVVDREVYLHCPDGYGRSKLSNAFFERRLRVAGTTRNWRTVTKLEELTRG